MYIYLGEGSTVSIEENNLLIEANRINYRLRSTFFYRKLKEYKTLSFNSAIHQILQIKDLYSWDNRLNWGIREDIFTYIDNHPNLQLIQVFCHPRLIREHSTLIAYYRNIAALSQKATNYLVGINVKKIETGQAHRYCLTEDKAFALARLFNEHISLIIDSSIKNFTAEELYGLLLASTGAQIDGSWRNAIGEEAEKFVQRLLIKEAKDHNLLAAFITRINTGIEVYDVDKLEAQLENIENYRGVMLKNETSIIFSSEPDISLLDNQGRTIGVIEIKGGADPAGALERYGSAKKSFEESRRINSEVITILVATCITNEVETRIQNDAAISNYFNLTEMLGENSRQYDQFIQAIFSILEA